MQRRCLGLAYGARNAILDIFEDALAVSDMYVCMLDQRQCHWATSLALYYGNLAEGKTCTIYIATLSLMRSMWTSVPPLTIGVSSYMTFTLGMSLNNYSVFLAPAYKSVCDHDSEW